MNGSYSDRLRRFHIREVESYEGQGGYYVHNAFYLAIDELTEKVFSKIKDVVRKKRVFNSAVANYYFTGKQNFKSRVLEKRKKRRLLPILYICASCYNIIPPRGIILRDRAYECCLGAYKFRKYKHSAPIGNKIIAYLLLFISVYIGYKISQLSLVLANLLFVSMGAFLGDRLIQKYSQTYIRELERAIRIQNWEKAELKILVLSYLLFILFNISLGAQYGVMETVAEAVIVFFKKNYIPPNGLIIKPLDSLLIHLAPCVLIPPLGQMLSILMLIVVFGLFVADLSMLLPILYISYDALDLATSNKKAFIAFVLILAIQKLRLLL